MLFHIYYCLRSELEYCLRALGHDHHALTTLPGAVLSTAQPAALAPTSPMSALPTVPSTTHPSMASVASVAGMAGMAGTAGVAITPPVSNAASAFRLEPNERVLTSPTLTGNNAQVPQVPQVLQALRAPQVLPASQVLPAPQAPQAPQALQALQALQTKPVVRLPDLPSTLPLPPTPHSFQSKLILIIDLDMTLVHAIHEEEGIARFNNWLYGASRSAEEEAWKQTLRPQLHAFDLVYIDEEGAQRLSHLLIKVRPGVQALLHTLASSYEMMVYTQGEDQYAEKVMQFIDPDG